MLLFKAQDKEGTLIAEDARQFKSDGICNKKGGEEGTETNVVAES